MSGICVDGLTNLDSLTTWFRRGTLHIIPLYTNGPENGRLFYSDIMLLNLPQISSLGQLI